MLSLYGMPGMGATGQGAGQSPQITPQLAALMQAIQQQQQGGQPGQGAPQFQPPGGPMGGAPGGPMGGAPGGPMSAMIGGGMHPGAGGQHPMAPPMNGQGPQPAAIGGGGNGMQLLQMLQALKGQQSGAAPQGGTSMFGASGMLPAWLQGALGGGAAMPQGAGATGPGGTLGGGV